MVIAGRVLSYFVYRNFTSLCDMKQFEDLFTEKKIISYLCQVRANLAKQRNKKHLLHILTGNNSYNYHTVSEEEQSDYEKDLFKVLNSILPPRRKWKNLGEKSRIKKIRDGTTQKLCSVDKNLYALIQTVNFYRMKKPNEPFVKELNAFIADIQASIKNIEYNISSPIIYPKPKDKKSQSQLKANEYNTCRPLSLFNLKDRIILSFTNKYLTCLFDKYFEPCSLAFRSIPNQVVNHHTAIQYIVEYKSRHLQNPLWVAECDMQKFYDSVNHKLILRQFQILVNFAQTERPDLDLTHCKRLFSSYLSCYSFNHDGLPFNDDKEYWLKYRIAKGRFGWIEKEIKHYNFYNDVINERIGVPQGGALSGLITNIVLDIADKVLLAKFADIFYTRFCDDMIIMDTDKEVCSAAIHLYKGTLQDLKLAPHEFSIELSIERKKEYKYLPLLTTKPFWSGKSKGPYKWDDVSEGGFPWIGFVGYEIHHQGAIRIRKSSLEKELKKQKDVVAKIKEAIITAQRKGKGTVTESAIKRLIGMSVSRVELWNYINVAHEMCWKNGFVEVNENKHSIKQLKRLDRSRSKLYYDLEKSCPDVQKIEEERKKVTNKEGRQIVGYGKPFSYYYHLIERAKSKNSDIV